MPRGDTLAIRDAEERDFEFVVGLMCDALEPYYGGDHRRHAERIFQTHVSGGEDRLGFFSLAQHMFIAEYDGQPAGMVHLVVKRQGTIKISPLIVRPSFRNGYGVGSALLARSLEFAQEHHARQIYCTVAKQNAEAMAFFQRRGFMATGESESHYKSGVDEVMLYKVMHDDFYEQDFDTQHISVLPLINRYAEQVRALLLEALPDTFEGIDNQWIDALYAGYSRRNESDPNAKYKLIFIAVDGQDAVRGVVGATPKKGSPIKLMPFVARDLPSFTALLKDVPFYLKRYGHKLYVHLIPSADETSSLQHEQWRLDAVMPGAYHPETVTQQWSLDIGERTLRRMRVKDRFLRYIQEGSKDLEVRVGYESIRELRVGEFVEFTSRTRTVLVRVTDVRVYASISQMLEREDPERIVPHYSKPDLERLLHEIYPPAKESLGVFVFQIQRI